MADLGGNLLGSLSSGLGGLFGAVGSLASTQAGIGAVGGLSEAGVSEVQPYNFQGLGYLNPITGDLLGTGTSTSAGSQNIGQGRINQAGNPLDFSDFAKNYNSSEGAQYLMRTAQAAQNNTAAAKGGLLSGANIRAQTGIAEGIANQDLIDQYKASLAGQQQDFQQRETSYQNLYGQEALGLQGGVAAAGTLAQGARAIGSLYGTQAQQATANANNIGTALGGLISSIGKLFS